MWRMLKAECADDFVIATGESHSLAEFVEASFSYFGLDWLQYTDTDESLFRPTDIQEGRGDIRKAAQQLGWQAQTDMAGVIDKMMAAELKCLK